MEKFFEAMLECLKAGGSLETRQAAVAAATKCSLRILEPPKWVLEIVDGDKEAWANLLVICAKNDCKMAVRRELYELSPFADQLLVFVDVDGSVKVLPDSMRQAGKTLGYQEELPGDFQRAVLVSFAPESLVPLHPNMYMFTYE